MRWRKSATASRISERAHEKLSGVEAEWDAALRLLVGSEDADDTALREQIEAEERKLRAEKMAQADAIGKRNRGET